MPPRYAYWTILVDDQPTAFRAGAKEDLLPTFNRLKEKHASATMMWFQNGKLWPSRLDAQEAMRARGEMGRRGDTRQGGGFRDRSSPHARKPAGPRVSDRPEWTPKPGGPEYRKPASPQVRKPSGSGQLEWKPKGAFTPAPKRSERPGRSEWKPKSSFDRDRKPDWKPKGSFDRERKPDWKPKGSFDRERKPEWKPRTSRSEKLDWKPKTESGTRNAEPGTRAKRAWIPKEEYKKSKGIEAKRDSKWRPGGEHRDPRQKYKDAKKAKWSRFKQNIRQKWDKKGRKKDDDK
jgi:hypothetical protein